VCVQYRGQVINYVNVAESTNELLIACRAICFSVCACASMHAKVGYREYQLHLSLIAHSWTQLGNLTPHTRPPHSSGSVCVLRGRITFSCYHEQWHTVMYHVTWLSTYSSGVAGVTRDLGLNKPSRHNLAASPCSQ